MPTDDNNAYGDLDKSNLKFIYEQFRRYLIYISLDNDSIFALCLSICLPGIHKPVYLLMKKSCCFQQILIAQCYHYYYNYSV